MTPLRSHDFPLQDRVQPNSKALRLIMAAFIAALMVCTAIMLSLILKEGRHRPSPQPTISPFVGVWKGSTAIISRATICDLRLEIPDPHTAFASFSCTIADPLLLPKQKADLKTEVICRLVPNAAIFSGAPEGGSIQFHAIHHWPRSDRMLSPCAAHNQIRQPTRC